MATDTTPGCDITIGDSAVAMVEAAYDKYTQFASQAFNLALTATESLAALELTPISFGVSWNVDPSITGYHRPVAPAAPGDLDFRDQGALADPPIVSFTPPTFDTAPVGPSNPAPVVRDFAQPGNLTATAPDDDVTLAPVPVAVRPDYELPPVPTLYDLNLPTAPVLNLPDFAGMRPDLDVQLPLENYAFTPEEYTSALLDKVRGRTSAMLDGGTGLPLAVASALRARAYSAVDQEELRAIQTATEEFAARGFSEPNGILVRRLAEVRQNNQNQRNALSRDIYIQDEQIAIENLRFAVTQGVALESQLFQAHNEWMRVAMDSAQFSWNVRVRVFEAQVSLANLNLQAYQTDVQVWREQLQAELTKLDAYRAELQAQQVIGELNQQQVQIYTERLRAVSTQVDLYRADLDAARTVVATNQQLIDLERSKIQNFSERVGAYRAEWDAYRTQLDTNTIRANVYSLIEQGYSTRLRSWSDVQQQKIAASQLQISQADLQLRGWTGKLDKLRADIQAETARVDAVARAYTARVQAYSAEAQVETAASDANLRGLQLAVESERARTDVALKNADMSINQLVEVSRLLQSKLQGVAQTSASMAASAMSAVNFSAGVHSARSASQSCSTGFSYSGTVDDISV